MLTYLADPISSATWHPSGAVLATCSGQRFPLADDDDDSSSSDTDEDTEGRHESLVQPTATPDNTLKVWQF